MKLLRRIIIVNLSAGAVGFLLRMGQYHWNRSEILPQLARSLTVAFFVGTPVVLMLMRYGPNMYRRRFPVNWILISVSILAGAWLACARCLLDSILDADAAGFCAGDDLLHRRLQLPPYSRRLRSRHA